ncbi:MAG: phosphatase family protein [Subtercola sp.]|nr:phosphatase family protein [Subtercola sp.]
MTTLRASETSFIVAVQRTRLARALVPAGKALSFFGEHAAGWILLGLLGAGIDWSHAGAWLLSVLAVIVAHGLSVVIKRVVRRPRPGAVVGADGKLDAGKGAYPVTAGGRVDARGLAEAGEQRASGADDDSDGEGATGNGTTGEGTTGDRTTGEFAAGDRTTGELATGEFAAGRGAIASAVKVYASAPSKLSFPSSHASSTMAACIVYTAFFPWLWPLAVVVALAMGVSRVILGMHFVTDVLAGYAIGLIVGVPTILLLHG